MIGDFPALEMHPGDSGSFRVDNVGDASAWNMLFGGQMLAQMVVAAATTSPGKQVRTIQAIFSRAGAVDAETEIRVTPVHQGRTLGSVSVGVWQGDRQCAQAQVLLSVDEPDHIAHTLTPPDVGTPDDARPLDRLWLVPPGGELRIAGPNDPWGPDQASAPAEISVWYRHGLAPDAITPEDITTNQGLLAWSTDGFLIAAAMLPHEEFRRRPVPARTAVVSHTLTFHRPFTVREWSLLVHESPSAGRGLGYGRCHVFNDGQLVASYVQDAVIQAAS
jgi:acyl-CoA thioesterase-2